MAKTGATGITRIINACGYSIKGLAAAFKYESAFRQEVALVVVMFPAAIWLGQTAMEYALLISSLLLVLIVELLNSAVEAVVDRTGDEWNALAGRAKDIGSAAVMISLINVVIIWALLFYQNVLTTI